MELPKYLPLEEYDKLPLDERLKRSLSLSKNDEDRAGELRKKLTFVDIHNHIVQLAEGNVANAQRYPRFLRENIQQSGLHCLFEAIGGHQDFLKTIRNIGTTFSVIDQNRDMTSRVFCADDIRRAKKEGKVGFLCDMEIQAVGPFLDRVDLFHGLGVRSMGLTYNTKNFVGDGFGERTDSGLSYFGLQVVDRMNKLKMIISIAHAGLKTAYDAIEYSRDPVLFTHNVTSVAHYHKTRSDELLKACAEKGGLIGLQPLSWAIAPNMEKTLEERKRVGIWDFLDHIDHAIDVMGVDHVCIGSDDPSGTKPEEISAQQQMGKLDETKPVEGRVWYGPRPKTKIADHALMPTWKAKDPHWPYAIYTEGFNGVAEWQNVTRGLISRGYSDQEIAKIVGENPLRLVERVVG